MAMRVVLDTNIWISWVLSRGLNYYCVERCRQEGIVAFYCDEMVAELADKVREKTGYLEENVYFVLSTFRKICQRVEITNTLHVVAADPDDDKFVECAVVAQADYVVSNDKHLLKIGSYEGIQFITPYTFLTLTGGLPQRREA